MKELEQQRIMYSSAKKATTTSTFCCDLLIDTELTKFVEVFTINSSNEAEKKKLFGTYRKKPIMS